MAPVSASRRFIAILRFEYKEVEANRRPLDKMTDDSPTGIYLFPTSICPSLFTWRRPDNVRDVLYNSAQMLTDGVSENLPYWICNESV